MVSTVLGTLDGYFGGLTINGHSIMGYCGSIGNWRAKQQIFDNTRHPWQVLDINMHIVECEPLFSLGELLPSSSIPHLFVFVKQH